MALLVAALPGDRSDYSTIPYEWDTLEVNGGGWVTGLVTTPTGARYVRTDVGGAYRWDASDRRWEQMLTYDGVEEPDPADYYVESLAVAPADDDVVYMAVGDTLEQRTGHILRSRDGGLTWSRSSQTFTIHGNAEWRQAGSRLAVDPQDSDVVYFGSRREGLWRSDDGGRRWRTVGGLPAAEPLDAEEPAGVTFVIFGAEESERGRASSLIAGVEGVGVLTSEDAGESWALAHPTARGVPRDAELASDGSLYVVVAGEDSEVVRLSPGAGRVDVISPGGSPAVVAVDPSNPERVFVGDDGIRDGYLWRSNDAGESWDVLSIAVMSGDDVWPVQSDLEEYMSSGELSFDLDDDGTLWFAEGMGVWRSDDLADDEVTWQFTSAGIEELVTNDVVVPAGADPVTAHWDRNILRHPSGGRAELALTGRFNSAWSLDTAPSDPSFVVAVVNDHRFCCDDDGLAAQSGVSKDGGRTWRRFDSLETGSHPDELAFGNIAVGGGDTDNLVWVPSNGGRVHYSRDAGRTWLPADYPGSEPHFAYYLHRQVLVSDPAAEGTFYVLDADGVMRSTDGGANWERMASSGLPGRDALRFNATLALVPGRVNELVLTTGLLDEGSHGLFRSRDAGATWEEAPVLQDVGRLGFAGAPATDGTHALFAVGRYGETSGLWRSADHGSSWSLISAAPAGRYQDATVLTGVPGSADEVLVGYTGTGVIAGRPR